MDKLIQALKQDGITPDIIQAELDNRAAAGIAKNTRVFGWLAYLHSVTGEELEAIKTAYLQYTDQKTAKAAVEEEEA